MRAELRAHALQPRAVPRGVGQDHLRERLRDMANAAGRDLSGLHHFQEDDPDMRSIDHFAVVDRPGVHLVADLVFRPELVGAQQTGSVTRIDADRERHLSLALPAEGLHERDCAFLFGGRHVCARHILPDGGYPRVSIFALDDLHLDLRVSRELLCSHSDVPANQVVSIMRGGSTNHGVQLSSGSQRTDKLDRATGLVPNPERADVDPRDFDHLRLEDFHRAASGDLDLLDRFDG